jgi:hypothetical protein
MGRVLHSFFVIKRIEARSDNYLQGELVGSPLQGS